MLPTATGEGDLLKHGWQFEERLQTKCPSLISPDRNQDDAASTCESLAAPVSGEASPLGERSSSSWGDSPAGPASLELTWGEDEVSDEGLLSSRTFCTKAALLTCGSGRFNYR